MTVHHHDPFLTLAFLLANASIWGLIASAIVIWWRWPQ